MINPIFTPNEADVIINLLENTARNTKGNYLMADLCRKIIAKIQTTEGYLRYAGIIPTNKLKDEFDEYVKNYSSNEWCVDKIFKEWVFKKLAELGEQ